MFTFLSSMPIYRSLPPMYADLWKHLEYEKKHKPIDDGGKGRRTAFIQSMVPVRNERIEKITARKEEAQQTKANQAKESGTRNYTIDTKQTVMAFQKLSVAFLARLGKPDYIKLLNDRKKLPVYDKKDHVLDIITKNQVVIISGETGSGKTTQIPQFILEDALANTKIPCNIVCTQPRR